MAGVFFNIFRERTRRAVEVDPSCSFVGERFRCLGTESGPDTIAVYESGKGCCRCALLVAFFLYRTW